MIIFYQLNKEFFDIIIIREGKLKLYNTFLFVSATDLIYFLLYACKQLKIDTKNTPFYFVGELTTDNSLIREIKPYISSFQYPEVADHIQNSPVIKKLDYNRFYSILYLLKCE